MSPEGVDDPGLSTGGKEEDEGPPKKLVNKTLPYFRKTWFFKKL